MIGDNKVTGILCDECENEHYLPKFETVFKDGKAIRVQVCRICGAEIKQS